MARWEFRWIVAWAAVVMAVTCLPYLYVAMAAPPGTTFTGLLTAADDHCVYLAWEEQAAQGRFFMRNLFTGEAQRGIYVSLLSWLIGTTARLTGLPLILVHHAARVLAGMLLLVLVYRLFALFTNDVAVRRAGFAFTACSAGFGWLCRTVPTTQQEVTDLWMPETITFQCLYVIGLFCVALCLMVGIFLLLLGAEGRNGRGRWGRVIGAGVLGLLLGNIHSYDVITMVCLWSAYLLTRAVTERRFPGRVLADAVVAGLVALPSTVYQYYLYRTEPVFRMRADIPTWSPPLTSFLLGYGLVLLLALGGAVCLIRTARRAGEPLGQRLLPLTWALAGFAIPYLPLAFQRKMVMGLHLPLAFLAAVGAVAVARRASRVMGRRSRVASPPTDRSDRSDRSDDTRRMTHDARPMAQSAIVAVLVLLTAPTNWQFVRRDIELAVRENKTRSYLPAYVADEDVAAMRWARRNLPKDGLILCAPQSGALFPALAGRAVYAGHPSETPNVWVREPEVHLFYSAANAPSEERRAFLERRGIRYVYQGPFERRLGPTDLARDPLFHPVYRNRGATLYELRPAGQEVVLNSRSPGSMASRARGPGDL